MPWIRYRVPRGGGLRRNVALVVIVAFVGTAVLAGLTGARRATTAVDRLEVAAGEFDLFVEGAESDPARWSRITDLPSVAGVVPVAFVYAFPDDPGYYPLLARMEPPGEPDDRLAAGHVIDGRRPDPMAADEVALSEHGAESLELSVGDTLQLATYTPAGAEAAEQSDDAAPDGEPIDVDVVGIVRSTQDVLARPGDPTVTLLPFGFYERYRGEVAMVEGSFLVRLVAEEGSRRAFSRELREAFAGGPAPRIDGLGSNESLDESMAVLAAGLAAFALVLFLAGVAAISQATSRSAARREPEQLPLAAMGLGRGSRWLDAWVPLMLAGLVGVAIAVVLAIAVSPLFPVGLARGVDPDLGPQADAWVLLTGGTVLLATVAGVGAWSAWRTSRWPVGLVRGTSSPLGRLVANMARSSGPAVAVGFGMAAAPGRGANAVPVRTAFGAVVLGVVGLVASMVFGAGMLRLLDTPERYGWTWDASLSAPPGELAEQSDVVALAAGVFNATVEVEGTSLFAFALDPVEGDVTPTIADGRAPVAPDEVALGADSRRRLDDPSTVDVVDAAGEAVPFEVVGTVVVPSIDDPVPMADGAYFTMDGFDRLGLNDPAEEDTSFNQTVVRFDDGVDVSARVDALALDDDPGLAEPPQEVERLEQVTGLPVVLAGLLAALGLLAVWQAIWQSTRRRRRDVAVLRAVGLDRAQITASFGWQAAVIAVAGTVVGVPLGFVLGRVLWTAAASSLGVATDVAFPPEVVAVVAVAVIAPVVLGLGLGARVARRPAAVDLRAE